MTIILDGIYDPWTMGFNLFILLEFITVIIELIIFTCFNRMQPKKKQWSFEDIFTLTLLMNIGSAILGAMVWLDQGGY